MLFVYFQHTRNASATNTTIGQQPEFIAFALAAAREALLDANLPDSVDGAVDTPCGPYSRNRVGVSLGSGIGAIDEIAAAGELLASDTAKGAHRLSPFFVPRILTNLAAGNVSITHRLKGPNIAPSNACATGANAIGDAFRLIQHGDADAMLAGGTESCICPLAVAGTSHAAAVTVPCAC